MKQIFRLLLLVFVVFTAGINGSVYAEDFKETVSWVQPSKKEGRPMWGFESGIRISLNPASIRGLIHVHAPYLGHPETRVINFFAIEPIVEGEEHRGFSELENSTLDGVRGKRIWSADSDANCKVKDASDAAQGVIGKENGVETLTVFLFVEPFDNGAKVYLRARFYENNPYEVEISTFQCSGSKKLSNCIVTATMGNYARLRTLYLKNENKTSLQIWPDYTEHGFAPHEFIPVNQMITGKNGFPYLIAASNEQNPQSAQYVSSTAEHWKYQGKPVPQYWYCKDPDTTLQGIVNGRIVYWASHDSIPGGISFENLEMKKQFKSGDRFVFGVSPVSVDEFIKNDNFVKPINK